MHNKKVFHFARNNILISHHRLGVGNSLFFLLLCRCIAFHRTGSSWDRCHNNKHQFGCYWPYYPVDIWLGISKFLDRNVLHTKEKLLHGASNWSSKNLEAWTRPRIEALKGMLTRVFCHSNSQWNFCRAKVAACISDGYPYRYTRNWEFSKLESHSMTLNVSFMP